MRSIQVVWSCLLLFCSPIVATAQPTQSTEEEKIVKEIQREFQRINKAKLTRRTIKWDNEGNPGCPAPNVV